jgi:hypothetical protein
MRSGHDLTAINSYPYITHIVFGQGIGPPGRYVWLSQLVCMDPSYMAPSVTPRYRFGRGVDLSPPPPRLGG